MSRGVCEECARRPAKHYLVHPISDEPVRVCDICERSLVKQIAGRRNVVGPNGVDLGSTIECARSRRRYRVASA